MGGKSGQVARFLFLPSQKWNSLYVNPHYQSVWIEVDNRASSLNIENACPDDVSYLFLVLPEQLKLLDLGTIHINWYLFFHFYPIILLNFSHFEHQSPTLPPSASFSSKK